jgi:hypothetical protein
MFTCPIETEEEYSLMFVCIIPRTLTPELRTVSRFSKLPCGKKKELRMSGMQAKQVKSLQELRGRKTPNLKVLLICEDADAGRAVLLVRLCDLNLFRFLNIRFR